MVEALSLKLAVRVAYAPNSLRLAAVWLCLGLTTLSALEKSNNQTFQLPFAPLESTYEAEPVWQELNDIIENPVLIVDYPESEGFVIVTKPGKLWHVSDSRERDLSLFLDLSGIVDTRIEAGLQSIAFHPDFAKNHQCFVYYNIPAGESMYDVVSRFTVTDGPTPRIDPASEEVLIKQFHRDTYHTSGSMLFGNDGYLYISVGDEGGEYDSWGNSQRIDGGLFSCIMRIDVDQREGNLLPNPSPSVMPGTYRVPADNPFVGTTEFQGKTLDPATVRTEIWALGLRNPWRMSYDAETGTLYSSDVGQVSWEEVNRIEKGGNYGWVYYEGNEQTSERVPPPGFSYIPPLYTYDRLTGTANVCGFLYRGDAYPDLDGALLFGDFTTGKLFRLFEDNGVDVAEIGQIPATVAFWHDRANDDIIVVSHYGENLFHRLRPDASGDTASEADLPARLSQVGIFQNMATLAVRPGIHPYEVALPFWSDHAIKSRWFGLTQGGSFTYSPTDTFEAPVGAFWVKHFELELQRGVPASARRIETRVLVRHESGVYGLTYRWNSAQTEATLVPREGATANYRVEEEDGTFVTQQWNFPSRSSCLSCHNEPAGYILGFNAAQLNRPHPVEGDNQLVLLQNAGYLRHESTVDPSVQPRLYAADDASVSLESRVRSYLHANCAACHRPAGAGLGFWDARVTTSTRLAGIVNGYVHYDFGDPDTRIVKMGRPESSSLFRRIASADARRMPPLGSTVLDEAAIELVRAWVLENAYTDFFPGAIDLGVGRKYDYGYGWFFDAYLPWTYNYAIGWTYLTGSEAAIWAYAINYGWVWTGHGTFPFVYIASENRWVYFSQADGTFGFYLDPLTNEWLYRQP